MQGIAFTDDGKVICSTSYSVVDSHILIYDNVLNSENYKTINLFDSDFNIYVLSNSHKIKDVTAPSMSEEIIYKNDRLYILYESACSKYFLDNRRRLKNVESILIEN